MAYKIIWSLEADKTLAQIIQYLEENWHDTDIVNFLDKLKHTLHLLEINPYLFRTSLKQHVHETLVSKHNLLIYEIDDQKKRVALLAFVDTRSNPTKKKKRISSKKKS